MTKTIKLLYLKKQHIKKQPTFINWKTFNTKQTGIHMPKLVEVLKKINKVLVGSVEKKAKITRDAILRAITRQVSAIKINGTEKHIYYTKQTMYQSIYNTKETKICTPIDTQVQMNTTEHVQIVNMYYAYILLSHIMNNVKSTKISLLTLPKKRTMYTVLKSPHADKKAREQFMKEASNIKIYMKQYIAILNYINSIVLSYTKAFIHSYKYDIFYGNKI